MDLVSSDVKFLIFVLVCLFFLWVLSIDWVQACQKKRYAEAYPEGRPPL